MIPLVIFLGAGIGGVARYTIGGLIQNAAGSTFPMGTLVINVSGSLLVALVYGILESVPAPPEWRAFLGIGFCGGYTTFSTFSYETVRLLQDGEWERASLYIMTSVFLSIFAAVIGFRLVAIALKRG